MKTSSIVELIEELKAGRMIVLADDEDRENEGDLVCAAEMVNPETINFMAKYARGLVCLSLEPEIVDRLQLPQMAPENRSPFKTAFTVSIEARTGVTTGISTADRARTIQVAVDPSSKASDLVTPGHVFPLRAEPGGALKRSGQTEGSVDLAKLAGFQGAGVICEIMNEDGSMARRPELESFAKNHGLKIGTIADLIRHRTQNESLVKNEGTIPLPTKYGHFELSIFTNKVDNAQHIALSKGNISSEEPCLVRVHSECITGDLFGSSRCDCGEQLESALRQIEQEGQGVVLYLRQEGRGIGLLNKIKAYQLQDEGLDTVAANQKLGFRADLRDYGIGAQILRSLGVGKMKLLTNNPKKIIGLDGYGMEVTDRVPLQFQPKKENIHYLRTKRDHLGHILDFEKLGDTSNDSHRSKFME